MGKKQNIEKKHQHKFAFNGFQNGKAVYRCACGKRQTKKKVK